MRKKLNIWELLLLGCILVLLGYSAYQVKSRDLEQLEKVKFLEVQPGRVRQFQGGGA